MTFKSLSGVMSSSLPQILSHSRNGKIHSLFERSFNIAFEEDLVNVNRGENQLSSFGINIAGSEMDAIVSAIAVGDLVKVRDTSIVIYSTYGTVFTIDTGDLAVKDMVLRPIEVNPTRLALIHQALEESGFSTNLGLQFNGEDKEKLAALLTEDTESEPFIKAAHFLVGRGKGLTPGGDDILTGYFLMLKLFAQDSGLTRSLLDFISQKTTAISVAYLKNLHNGFISEYFMTFRQAAVLEDLPRLKAAVETIKAIGHTSGFDTLLGMSLGISKIEGETQNSFVWQAI